MLASLGAGAMPDHPSSLYVERLFDDYAERFDHALIKKLAYSVPRKLAALIAETEGLPQHFRLAVDLGCGTGLLGPEIRNRIDRLEGFDLSGNMLAKAAEKHVYDLLGIADLSLPAAGSGLFGTDLSDHRADLITASDVFIYLGALENLFALLGLLSAPQAVFAFSVEDGGRARVSASAARCAMPIPDIMCRRSANNTDLRFVRRPARSFAWTPGNRSQACCLLRKWSPEIRFIAKTR